MNKLLSLVIAIPLIVFVLFVVWVWRDAYEYDKDLALYPDSQTVKYPVQPLTLKRR